MIILEYNKYQYLRFFSHWTFYYNDECERDSERYFLLCNGGTLYIIVDIHTISVTIKAKDGRYAFNSYH